MTWPTEGYPLRFSIGDHRGQLAQDMKDIVPIITATPNLQQVTAVGVVTTNPITTPRVTVTGIGPSILIPDFGSIVGPNNEGLTVNGGDLELNTVNLVGQLLVKAGNFFLTSAPGLPGLTANLQVGTVDLSSDTGVIRVSAPDGIVLGDAASTKIKSTFRTTGILGIAAIPASTTATQNIACPGAQVGAEVIVGGPATLEAGLILFAYVSALDVITLRVSNVSLAPIAPAAAQVVSVRCFNP